MGKKEKEAARSDFLSEAEEIVEELTTDIQNLEASVKRHQIRPELINKIFREFHSLKGISGMLGFDRISGFTHELENMLDKMRLGKLEVSAKTIDLLYQALDILNRLISEISEEEQQTDASPLLGRINEALQQEVIQQETLNFPEVILDEQTVRSFTEYEEHRLRENIKTDINLFSVRLVLENTTFDQDLRNISKILNNYGEIISTLPSFDMAAGPDKMIFRLIFATFEGREDLLRKLNWPNVEISDIRRRQQMAPLMPLIEEDSELDRAAGTSLKSLSPTVRVDIHKLDEVINVIGELVITKAMLMNLGREVASIQGNSRTGIALSKIATDLEKKLNELQRNVIETRLVPIGHIYNKLSRIIRKLSRETNKKVDLLFFGEDTELDKIMIEQLADPLMHIIRNAIDHGIESPEERVRAGKPETSVIKLSAFQRGNSVVIQIQDDGRGLQMRKIQEQARKRGLLSKDQDLDMKECIEVIFSPGFSSSDHITELSGRGVGLDVVKKNISELKGSIAVFSKEGSGTVFEITLPITLAIIQALIVRINQSKWAIPLSSVEETVSISTPEIQTVDRKEVYRLRERTLPLIRVNAVFKLPGEANKDSFYLVVVKVADQYVGLVVDELAGQQEIVIKSMGERLKNIPGIAGATEIGEKKPVLVIDAESLVEEVTHGKIRPM